MSYVGGYAQVSYLNFERQRLPEELMKAERAKHTGIEIDRLDIEVQVCIVVQITPLQSLCFLHLFDEPE
jgi:hypothetical protein